MNPLRARLRGRGAPPRAVALIASLLLAACASSTHRAPVEDRAPGRPVGTAAPVTPATVPAPVSAPAATPVATASSTPAPTLATPAGPTASAPSASGTETAPRPGAENAGKPGFYTVKPGDTLIRIGLETGQNWRDLARWNGIDNPNVLEVGQVIRVAAPPPDPNAAVTRPVAPAPRIDSRPLEGRPAAGAPAGTGSAPVPAAAPSVVPGTSSPPVASPGPAGAAVAGSLPGMARDGDDDIVWGWPAAGVITAAFDDARNKGVAIAGKAGDPVLAAADGRVVYAGSGLRGYGNLVIVKHNNTYLTAYAHNQTLLVKEEQVVRRGQKIAEMGASDAERVQLHFEVRRQGKPVDPTRVLPPR